MKVLATYSIKGGVGKTAAAVNLAYLAARDGEPSLLWDLDPQGAATFLLRVRPKVKGGARAIVRRKRPVDSWIKSTDFANFDLVPADLSYRHLDLALDRTKKPTEQLADILRPAGRRVQLRVPRLRAEHVARLREHLRRGRRPAGARRSRRRCRCGRSTNWPTSSATTARSRRRSPTGAHVLLARRSSQATPPRRDGSTRRRGPDVLEAAVPSATEVEQMGKHRAPVAEFAPSSRAARSYEDLWSAIRKATE